LIHKSRQTLWFAILLEEYLKIERRVHPHVFRRLHDCKVQIPQEGDIVANVVRDLDRITKHVVNATTRAEAYDAHCSNEYIAEVRATVKGIVEASAAPQFKLRDAAYENF